MGVSSSKHGSHHRYHHHNHRPSLPSGQTPQSQQLSSDIYPNTNINNNNNNTIANGDAHTNNYTQQHNPIPSSSLTNPLPPPTPPLPRPQPPTYATYNFHSYQFRPPPPPLTPPFSSLSSGWVPYRPPATAVPPPMIMRPPLPLPAAPPPYVDHNHAKKIKNDVNVHKDSIRVVPDESKFGDSLVSFTFDALVDGSISIFYFAKEGANCTFMPLYPEIYSPRRIPFKKGLGQRFCQPSGTGIDLGFFELDDLSKPSAKEDVFPLVIFAEACSPSFSGGTEHEQSLPTVSPNAQITQAVLEKNREGLFQVKVIKQILWVEGVRYELREIYGIGNNDASFDDSQSGEECVICMTDPKDTAVLPCRHMCLCNECAKELRLKSNRCPICRQPIEELMEIRIQKDGLPAR